MKEGIKFWLVLALTVALFVVLVITHSAGTQASGNTALLTPDDAKTTYGAKCAGCHGKDGRGKTFRGKLARARAILPTRRGRTT
ncbi:MAG TPA: cytochrome c [Pyrinomonadaceae bacterium]|nr:cytochrome c [Pyrinomonadaceae bacterium]